MPKKHRTLYTGIDIGGTSIKIGLVDEHGNTVDAGEGVAVIKTNPDPQATVEAMAEVITGMFKQLGIDKSVCGGVGLGVPTQMDKHTRKLRRPDNIPTWKDFPMCDELSKSLGLPVVFCNDGNAAAYGEYWVGSASAASNAARKPDGSKISSLVLLTLGTGIGAGIIIDGKSIDGDIGFAGECGHIIVDPADDAMLCGCEKRGCVEAYCSATGVALRTINMVMHRESSIRPKITPKTKLSDIPKIVYTEAESGDALALEIVSDTAKYLGIAVASLLHTIDVACILFGGAMTFGGKDSPLGQHFLSLIARETRSRVFPAIADNVLIDFASLGTDAGYIGAAGIAKACVHGDF